MPSTTKKLATLRPDLATFEQLDMEMNRMGLVGAILMPPYEVQQQAGNFGLMPIKAFLAMANADTRRTSQGGYNRGDWEFEDRFYQTKENGWEEPVDDREEAMYGSYFALEEIATHRAWETVMMNLEQRVIKTVVTDQVAAARTQAATALWTNFVTAKPIDDIQSAQDAVWLRTGLWPRTVAMARRDYRNLRRCEQILKEIKADGAGEAAPSGRISKAQIAEVLDVDEIIISGAIRNTANRAKAVQIGSAWPEGSVAVLKTPSNMADFKSAAFGRIFHWGGDGSRVGGQNLVGVAEMYRDDATRKDISRVRHETSEYVLYPELAQVITGVR